MNTLLKRAITAGTHLLIVAFSIATLGAQQPLSQTSPKIQFDKKSHNFGIIAEEGGMVYYRFLFTNAGESPLVITRVTTDCGCTTTSYTRDAVDAGDEGFINVAYDPMGRPGSFVKNIQVYTNAEGKPFKLQITGNVTTQGGVEGEQSFVKLGSVQLSSDFLAFPAVSGQRPQTIRFALYNTSLSPVKVSLRVDKKLFTLSESELRLEGNQPAEVMITTTFGPTEVPPAVYASSLELTLEEENLEPQHKTIALKLPVVPSFVSQDKKQYPKADLTTYYDLGKIEGETPIEGYFEIGNKGETPLELLDIYCPNKAIAFHTQETKAAKGKVMRVAYRIDTALLLRLNEGFDENIDLILNDPRAPYRRVKIVLSL